MLTISVMMMMTIIKTMMMMMMRIIEKYNQCYLQPDFESMMMMSAMVMMMMRGITQKANPCFFAAEPLRPDEKYFLRMTILGDEDDGTY